MYFIRHRWMVWTSLIAAVVLLVYLMSTTKTGLVPQEDQGVIMVNVSISPGSTLDETTRVMDKLESILQDTPEIEHYARVAGYGLISIVRMQWLPASMGSSTVSSKHRYSVSSRV